MTGLLASPPTRRLTPYLMAALVTTGGMTRAAAPQAGIDTRMAAGSGKLAVTLKLVKDTAQRYSRYLSILIDAMKTAEPH